MSHLERSPLSLALCKLKAGMLVVNMHLVLYRIAHHVVRNFLAKQPSHHVAAVGVNTVSIIVLHRNVSIIVLHRNVIYGV